MSAGSAVSVSTAASWSRSRSGRRSSLLSRQLGSGRFSPIRADKRTEAPAVPPGCSAAPAAGRRWSRDPSGGDRRYICATGPTSGCGHMYAMAEPLEQFVVEAVLYRLDSPELAPPFPAPPSRPRRRPLAQRSNSRNSSSKSWQQCTDAGKSELSNGRRPIPIERRVTQVKKRLARLHEPRRLPDMSRTLPLSSSGQNCR